jgi:hypothetical protein
MHTRLSAAGGLAVLVLLGTLLPGLAAEGVTTAIYEGRIKTVKIDKCGLQPGLCEGAIVLAQQGGGEAAIDVRVGTWIKRGERFLTIEDLHVGEAVKVQAFRRPGDRMPRAAIVEFTSP